MSPTIVQAEWDPEVSVWVAASRDVPGLIAEAETLELLVAKLKLLIPELLDANGGRPSQDQVEFDLLVRRC